MAQRRLFSPDIVKSDAFLDMPVSSRDLYFYLAMDADDDGFVNPKRIIRAIGASDDDLKVLLSKRFVLPFESGVIVIKHWLIHNSIRKDRYNETKYLEEKKTLFIKDNKAYSDVRQPVGNQSATQVKLSKVNLSKIELPLWLNKKSWEEWIQYRKESKKKMTDITIRKQLKFLELHIKDHIKIIERSITNGWQGLFALENNHYLSPSGRNDDMRKILKNQKEDREAKEEREASADDDEARKKLNEDIKKLVKEKTLK